jgi:methionyl-tRNA formyltransferase
LNIIFAGTPEFAANSLDAIIKQGHHVIAVYTQPDRRAGRGKKILKSAVKVVAQAHGLPVYQPEKLTDQDAKNELAALKPDLMIVAAYGLLLPTEVLATPTLGCVNIHASLLPRWRGAAPIQRAIQAGDTETGITIMQMDEGLDTGNMLMKVSTPITETDSGATLHDKLSELGSTAILRFLESIKDKKPEQGEAQKNELANYAHKLRKQEAAIDWSDDAHQICLSIRAFNPTPVAFLTLNNERIRVFEAEIVHDTVYSEPAMVLEKNKHGIVVSCGKHAIRILKLQLPGAKAITAQAFFHGGKNILNVGDNLNTTANNSGATLEQS